MKKLLQRRPPRRQWFPCDDGGGYYRNCSLITNERDEVMAWPLMTPGRFDILHALHDEWDATFSRGVQYQETLGPRDVCVKAGPVRSWWPELVSRYTEMLGAAEAAVKLDEFDAMPARAPDAQYRWRWANLYRTA